MSTVVIALPPADSAFMQLYQGQLEGVFGNSWRIALGSMIAFWCGSFANSYVLARLKVRSEGRWLWVRTIGSTAVGELVDSALFYVIAFSAIWPIEDVLKVALAQYILKTSWEILSTPLTYWLGGRLKRAEEVDGYDRHTNFNPFRLRM